MCEFLLTDKDASIKVVMFPKVYAQFNENVIEGKIVFISGTVRYDNEARCIYVREIYLQDNSKFIGLMRKVSSNVVIPKKTEDDIIVHSVGKIKFKLSK
jgi:DNA polymerase III alpha subunit